MYVRKGKLPHRARFSPHATESQSVMRHAVLRLIRQFYGTVENAQKGNMSPLCHILRLGSRGDTSEFGNILGEAERRLGSRSRDSEESKWCKEEAYCHLCVGTMKKKNYHWYCGSSFFDTC